VHWNALVSTAAHPGRPPDCCRTDPFSNTNADDEDPTIQNMRLFGGDAHLIRWMIKAPGMV
jgi:hypothetical protein